MTPTTKCETCGGDGEIETCNVCANTVDNCECESFDDATQSEMTECPECDGEGEYEEEETCE